MLTTSFRLALAKSGVLLMAATAGLNVLGGRTEAASATGSSAFGAMSARHAPTYDRIIFPTGTYPQDVETVQAAVDLGGRVLMKAVNDEGVFTPWAFGPAAIGSGRVILSADVAIVGERIDAEMTTIQGGWLPFFKPFGGHEPIRLKIVGLSFEGPLFAAIRINRSIDVEITDNRIANVQGELRQGLTIARGISLFGGNDPDAITGRVTIEDNLFEDIAADDTQTIQMLVCAARTTIAGNVIRRVKGFAINVVLPTEEDVDVQDNLVTLDADAGGPFPDNIGIAVWGGGGTTYRIFDNVVITANSADRGILVFGFGAPDAVSGAVVERNQITMNDAFIALELGGEVHRTLVSNNQFRGSALAAIAILEVPPSNGPPAIGNTLMGNSIAPFESAVADVFLDSHTVNTVLTGFGGTVIDLGTNNQITGLSPIESGVDFGQQLKDARALIRR